MIPQMMILAMMMMIGAFCKWQLYFLNKFCITKHYRSADESDSDGIEFEHDSDGKSKSVSTVSSVKHTETSDITEVVNQIDFMYIQMEFCEKSTLRTAIDDGLYLNEDRLWRLFREIVEGKF